MAVSSVLCQGPFRFQNIPIPLLISVFLPSDVYLCLSLIAHCCHSECRQTPTDSVTTADCTGLPQNLIRKDSSQTLKELHSWPTLFEEIGCFIYKEILPKGFPAEPKWVILCKKIKN